MNYFHKLSRTSRFLLWNLEENLVKKQRIQRLMSSRFQRPEFNLIPKERLLELKTRFFQNRDELSEEEWKLARESLMCTFKNIGENNVDAIILGICSESDHLGLAKSYVAFLRKNGQEPNVATLGRLLKCYYIKYQSAGVDSLEMDEQREILDICASIRRKHDVLDSHSCEYLILGLATTDSWRDGLELIEMTKLTTTPSVSAYTALIVKAFRVGNLEIGWSLLLKMLDECKQPTCDIFTAYLQSIPSGDENNFLVKFEMLLELLGSHQLQVTQEVCRSISTVSEKYPSAVKVTQTKLSRTGKCNSCSTELQDVAVSDVEFAQLSNSFLNKVLIRNDVFQKSTPEEVQHFKRYVSETGPYDCVLDGLNVAYSTGTKKSPRIVANLLADVVKYFNKKNKHILVLGRKHMDKWPKDVMQFIRRNACLFLTNDLTHDDPFLLYATLRSGPSTDFFSRDLMRSHAYLLGTELKAVFRRWQQQHQYTLVTKTQTGRIIVKEPVRHMIYAHKVNTSWHVPCREEYTSNPPEKFEVPENWLCIKLQNKKQ